MNACHTILRLGQLVEIADLFFEFNKITELFTLWLRTAMNSMRLSNNAGVVMVTDVQRDTFLRSVLSAKRANEIHLTLKGFVTLFR